MKSFFLSGMVLVGLGVPFISQAATFSSAHFLTIASSTPDNAYLAGGEVRILSSLPADLLAAGGTITVAAPVAGDAELAGGTVDIQRAVTGDVRAVGGRVLVEDTVGGDISAAGGIVIVSSTTAKDMHLAGGTIQVTNGSAGPVTIYGIDVTLGGTYAGDVEVIASDKVTITPGTVIHGTFKYNAPQQADIPTSAHIDGGLNYVGSAAFLPTVQQAKTFAVAGLWVFLLVRILAAIVAAGLIGGLFPVFAERIAAETLTRTPERSILLLLLGLASFIAVPVLFTFLIVSFVGIGLALIIGAAYLLFLLLSYVYAAVIIGGGLWRLIKKDAALSWQTAILGVVVLWLIGSIPVLGLVLKVLVMALAGGAILSLFYSFVFPHKYDISSL